MKKERENYHYREGEVAGFSFGALCFGQAKKEEKPKREKIKKGHMRGSSHMPRVCRVNEKERGKLASKKMKPSP